MKIAKIIFKNIVAFVPVLLLPIYFQPISGSCLLEKCHVCLMQSCPESCFARCCIATMICCCGSDCRDWCRFNVRNPIRECCAKLSCPQMQRNNQSVAESNNAAHYVAKASAQQSATIAHQPPLTQSTALNSQAVMPTFSSAASQLQAQIPVPVNQTALSQSPAATSTGELNPVQPALLAEFTIPPVSGARRAE